MVPPVLSVKEVIERLPAPSKSKTPTRTSGLEFGSDRHLLNKTLKEPLRLPLLNAGGTEACRTTGPAIRQDRDVITAKAHTGSLRNLLLFKLVSMLVFVGLG